MNYIDALKERIETDHKCEATYRETVQVVELFEGKKVWQGEVFVFDLSGHPKAKRCYGWGYLVEKKPNRKHHLIAVLELPPVDSARKAVQMAIASGQQK